MSAAPRTTERPNSSREVPGDLADRRRLAGAVDADHQQHRRLAAEVDRGARGGGDLGEDLDQALAHRLAVGGDAAALDLVLEPFDHLGRGRRADVGEDQRLLQPLPGLVVDALEEAGRDLLGQRLAALGEALAQAAEDAAALLGALSRRGVRALARTEVEYLLPTGRHRFPRGGYPGGGKKLLHGLPQVSGDAFEVGHRGAVGEQAEADLAVVADDRDRQRVATGEEADREDPLDLAAEHVEGDLRPGEVGDEQVEEPGREVDRRGRAQQQRRREVAEPVVEAPDRFRAQRLLGGLQRLHRLVDGAQALDRVGDADRQRPAHRRQPVAQLALLVVGADRDRAPAPSARGRRLEHHGRASSGAGRRPWPRG